MNTMTQNRSRLQVAILTAAILLPLPMGAWAETDGLTDDSDPFATERAGGLDSAGADPRTSTTGTPNGLDAHALNAATGVHDRINAVGAEAALITADINATQSELSLANASVSAAATAGGAAQSAASAGSNTALFAAWNASVALTHATEAKTTSTSALENATTAQTKANNAESTVASETVILTAELETTTAAAAAATAYQANAAQASTDATDVYNRAVANVTAARNNNTAAKAAHTRATNALASATTADSTATTADATAVNADTQGKAAYELSAETIKYLPRSGLGVERKAGGDKMIIDAEYLSLTNQKVVSHNGTTAVMNTTSTSTSALTFIAGVFAGDYQMIVQTARYAAGGSVSVIVDGVTVRTTTMCNTSGTWCGTRLYNIPLKYGSTVRIEFGTGKTIYTNWIALCRNSDSGTPQSEADCRTI